jgi:type 1 fimbria pilin
LGGAINSASAACQLLKAAGIHFTVPQNLVIPRDVPWGYILYQSAPVPIDSEAGVKCDTSESMGFRNRVGSKTSWDIATISGSSIGYRIRVEPRFKSDILQFFGEGNGETTPVGEFRLKDYKFRLELYWLGPAVSGPAMKSGLFADYYYGDAETIRFFVDNPVTTSKATCAGQDVSVSMGSQKASGFSGGKNSLTPVPFAINLDCQPGINSVAYQLDATVILDKNLSIIALNKSSAVSGIGIQILNDLDEPLPLGKTIYCDGIRIKCAGGRFSIPLKAAYYKIADTVKAGTVNASLTFTMTYR